MVVAALVSAGCASDSYNKRQAAASSSLQVAADEVQAESRAIEVTLAALNDLINKPPANLKAQFQSFSLNLDHLTAAAHRNQAAAARVAQRSAAYFQDWDKELVRMNFEAVRNRSVARKTEVAQQTETVNRHYQEA